VNSSVFNKKNFITGIFWFVSCFIYAQENDLYKRLIKETFTVDKDFFLAPHTDLFNDSVSNYIELDANKMYFPHMGFNYKQNSLYINYKDSLLFEKEWTVPSALTMNYTNKERFDPASTETTGDMLANGFLSPLLSILTLKPTVLALYLMQIGVLSDEPFVPKESKKQRALREINTIYDISK
jgi:hypothetical protein